MPTEFHHLQWRRIRYCLWALTNSASTENYAVHGDINQAKSLMGTRMKDTQRLPHGITRPATDQRETNEPSRWRCEFHDRTSISDRIEKSIALNLSWILMSEPDFTVYKFFVQSLTSIRDIPVRWYGTWTVLDIKTSTPVLRTREARPRGAAWWYRQRLV